nr:hypothetical protein CFP56_14518 [Quercus suber]
MSSAEENPRKWRFTWEAQSQIPILRLFLFDSHTKPSIQCQNLKVHLNLSQSLLQLRWFDDRHVSLRVPIPRVLLDPEWPLSFTAFDDHIQVKLVLLLPVDHPIVSSFDSVLNFSQGLENASFDASKPLEMDSDLKMLSSSEGVHFHCRSCSFKLTKTPLRDFVEMPSVNWREAADNWFGNCCCSFGGVSEKLVNGLDARESVDSDLSKDVASATGCCVHVESNVINHVDEDWKHQVSETTEIKANQKSFLNGFLGNIFMILEFDCSNVMFPLVCQSVDQGIYSGSIPWKECLQVSSWKVQRMNQHIELCKNTDFHSRMIKDWETKNLADEVFMLTRQIKELIKSLVSGKDLLPLSCSCLQGLSLSSIQR